MNYLVCGLGNLGEEYQNTRHNAGFLVLDYISQKENFPFADKRYGFIAQYRLKNKLIYFLKPSTYMNNSGKAVRYWLKHLELPLENLLVVVDDLALPLGTLRLRAKGSPGGHNGLIDIMDRLETENFSRLRVGIGNEYPKGRQIDYVLSELEESEMNILASKFPIIFDMIKNFVLEGVDRTMSKYNE